MPCWHLSTSSKNRLPIFPTEHLRRLAVRKLAKIAGVEMVMYCVVDNHAHAVVSCSQRRSGFLKLAIYQSLGAISAEKILPVYRTPVDDRRHLRTLVRYFLEQVVRHDLGEHPALWSGSCFQDVIGARSIRGLHIQQRFQELLPRIHKPFLCELVGLPVKKVDPAFVDDVREAGIVRLVEAAGVALSVGPDLSGRTRAEVLARRAVYRIARNVGFSSGEVAWALKISKSAVRGMADKSVEVEREVLSAVCVRLSVENLVARLPHDGGGPGNNGRSRRR